MSKRAGNADGAGSPPEGMVGLLDHRLFKALCDPGRLAILCRLAEGRREATVSRVAECCPTDISVVSRHLAMLRDAGILHAERRGKEVFYSVRCSELSATLRRIADAIDACCPPSCGTGKSRTGSSGKRKDER